MTGNRVKVIITISILLVGTVLTLVAGIGSGSTVYQSEGTAIDFGDMDVVWTDVDLKKYDDAKKALEYMLKALEIEPAEAKSLL